MLQSILRYFGYMKVRWGFSCGRHWIEIDGITIAQTPGDDVFVPDEIAEKIYDKLNRSS